MRRRYISLVLVCLLVLTVGAAQAAITPLIPNKNNRIDFDNWEYVKLDVADGSGNLGTISVGDIYHGVLQAKDIGNGPFGAVIKNLLPTNTGLLGIFELQVKGFTANGEVLMGPSSTGWNTGLGLSANTMIAVWAKSPNPLTGAGAFDPTLGSDAAVEANITSGTLLGAFGFRPDNGNADAYDTGFFLSAVAPGNASLPPATGIGTSFGLFALNGTLPIIRQAFPASYASGEIPTTGLIAASGDTFDLVGKSQVTPVDPPGAAGHYSIFSKDPTLLKLSPEPHSIAMLCGLAVVTIGVARRRRAKR